MKVVTTNFWEHCLLTCWASYINRPLTIVSTDRGPAALKLFEDGNELDKASSLLCQQHLEANLKVHGFAMHNKEFRAARADASSEADYEDAMREVMKVAVKLHAYLRLVDHWQLWPPIVKGCMAFGFRSDNMVEGLFAAILAARRLSAYFFMRMVTLQTSDTYLAMLIRIRKWKNMNCGWLIFRYQRHCNIVDVSHRELNERPRSHSPHLMVGIWHQTKMHAWFRFSEAAAIHNSSKDNSKRLDNHCWKYSRNTMI